MAFDNLKFAKQVNEERLRLIESAKQRGIDINEKATLKESVNANIIKKDNYVPNYHKVTYVDIDGTVLKVDYVEEGGQSTTPTENPNYDPDYLVFKRWVGLTEKITKNISVAPQYETKDGNTYYFVKIRNQYGGLRPRLYLQGQSGVIDWGDGNIEEISLTSIKTAYYYHDYTEEGDYVIKLSGDLIPYRTEYFFGSEKYNLIVEKVYFGNNINFICERSFNNCRNLKVFVGKEGIDFSSQSSTASGHYGMQFYQTKISTFIFYGKTIYANAFYNAYKFKYLVIDNVLERLQTYAFYGTQIEYIDFSNIKELGRIDKLVNLKVDEIIINEDVEEKTYGAPALTPFKKYINKAVTTSTTYQQSRDNPFDVFVEELVFNNSIYRFVGGCYYQLYNLKKLVLPPNVTSFERASNSGNRPFQNMYSIETITIPPLVTRIDDGCFSNAISCKELIIQCNSVPVLGGANFSSYHPDLIIWVNDDIIEEMKSATNWSTYADKMFPLSEKPDTE